MESLVQVDHTLGRVEISIEVIDTNCLLGDDFVARLRNLITEYKVDLIMRLDDLARDSGIPLGFRNTPIKADRTSYVDDLFITFRVIIYLNSSPISAPLRQLVDEYLNDHFQGLVAQVRREFEVNGLSRMIAAAMARDEYQ